MTLKTAIGEATGTFYGGSNGYCTSIIAILFPELPQGPEKRSAKSYKNEFSDLYS
jgi:hypothetical protein